MCLFSDDNILNCHHSQCQIVQTIKNLNSNIFYKKTANNTQQYIQSKKHGDNIWNAKNETHFHAKGERAYNQRREQGNSEQMNNPETNLNNFKYVRKLKKRNSERYRPDQDKVRIKQLQMEVQELKKLTFQMKKQLQQQGLINI